MKGKNSNNYKRRAFSEFEIEMSELFRKLYIEELSKKEKDHIFKVMNAWEKIMRGMFPSSKDQAKITKIIKSFE